MSLKEIPLRDLKENEYNPRKTFSDAKMVNLRESIEKIGLVEPLVVRQLDGEDGEYEVIAGIRRLRALQDTVNGDHEVPCNVLDVDLPEAKLIALSENLEREELTPMEEAHAFAEYVEVEVGKDEAEALEEAGVEIRKEKEKQRRPRWYVNFLRYIKHIKGGLASESNTSISLPRKDSKSVQKASDTIPGVTPSQIADRVALLVLPEKLRTAVENDDLTQKAAQELVRLRNLKKSDPWEAMEELGSEYIGKALSKKDMDRLHDRVDEKLKSDGRAEKKKKTEVRNILDAADTSYDLLQHAISDAQRDLDEADVDEADMPEPNGNYLVYASNLVKSLNDKMDELGTGEIEGAINELTEKRDALRTGINDLDGNECVYCRSWVRKPTLEDEIDSINREIRSKRKDAKDEEKLKAELREIRKDVERNAGDHRSDIEDLKDKWEEGLDFNEKNQKSIEAHLDRLDDVIEAEKEENEEGS